MIELPTERADEIYCSALEIKSPDQRRAFLERACLGDMALRAVVEKLLLAQPEAEVFFQEGGVARLPISELAESFANMPDLVAPTVAVDEAFGKVIGAYK